MTINSVDVNGDKTVVATGSDEEAGIVVEGAKKVTEGLSDTAIATVSSAQGATEYISNLIARFGVLAIIIPVLIIIGALYLVQKFITASFEGFGDRKLFYWMAAFMVLAIFFALLSIVPIALTFLALFLITVAWHLFNIAVSDMEESILLEKAGEVTVDRS